MTKNLHKKTKVLGHAVLVKPSNKFTIRIFLSFDQENRKYLTKYWNLICLD